MKISIISCFKIGTPNGVSNYSDGLAKWLSKDNEVLYVVLGEKINKYKDGNLTVFEIPSKGTPIDDFPLCSPKVAKELFKVLDEFDPEVLQINTIFFNGILAIDWAMKKNKPVLYTLHTLPSKAASHSMPKIGELTRLVQKGYSAYLKTLFDNLYIHALNEESVASALEINNNAKVFKQNLYVDMSKFEGIKPKTPEKIKKFVYIGTYGKRKNQKYLVKVFEKLPIDCRLSLYGPTPDMAYYRKLSKYIKKKSINNIELYQTIENSKVPRILEKADYFVTASKSEVQSIAIIEAFASGTPVVGLENTTINELVSDSNGKKLSKETTESEFAKQILELCSIPEDQYIELATNAKSTVTMFEIDIVGKNMIELYEVCVNDFEREEDKTIHKKYVNTLSFLTRVGCGIVGGVEVLS